MTQFVKRPHSQIPAGVIEVWEDGQMIAAIYPKDRGVKIVSKYLDGRRGDLVTVDPSRPPALHVNVWLGAAQEGEPW